MTRRIARSVLVLGMVAFGAPGCADPGRVAEEVIAARGDCNEDSLRAGAESCVNMFQRYAEIATGMIHTYIGGVKALDEAVRRMPPPDFDTSGVGRARSGAWVDPIYEQRWLPGPEREGRASGGSSTGSPFPQGWGAPGEWAGPPDPQLGPPRPYGAPAPHSGWAPLPDSPVRAPGVLLPPEERLRRPWIDEREHDRFQRLQPAPYGDGMPYPWNPATPYPPGGHAPYPGFDPYHDDGFDPYEAPIPRR